MEKQKQQEESKKGLTFLQKVHNTANEGCLLHQLYVDEVIEEEEFRAGLAFSKLYHLAMRSLGIHTRVHTSSKSWGDLYGITYDKFSQQKVEGLWRHILKALDPAYHNGLSMKEIAFNLILIPPPKLHSVRKIRKTLRYLMSIWEQLEGTPYQLGLYSYKRSRSKKSLH